MARRKPAQTHGLAVVDKPAGMTSHDVVQLLRRRFDERQVGHSGTLDPDATGVLVVGVGKVTRLMRFLTALGKAYTAEIVFGTTTSTLDASGEVTASYDMAGLTLDRVRAAAAGLTGDILQVPPMVSALKVGGRRLHQLAREGVEVERAPRPVTVHRFDLEPTGDPLVFAASVQCSSGTYVRTLADDLGRMLGGGAHLRSLRRTAVGGYTEAEARPPDSCSLLPPAEAVRGLPSVVVPDDVAAAVRHGRPVHAPSQGLSADGPWALFDSAGSLLGVYEVEGGAARAAVVLAT